MAGILISAALDLLSSIKEQLFSAGVGKVAEKFKLVQGVDEEVEKLASNFRAIRAVIEDAEKRQVNDSAVKLWLSNLKDVCYDIDDVLDEWNTAILKLSIEHAPPSKKPKLVPSLCSPLSSFDQVPLRHDIAKKIKELNGTLDQIAIQKIRYQFNPESASHVERRITTSIIDESEVFGREGEKERIEDMLCSESSPESTALRVISIVGAGGMGKTTLTRLAYNDHKVISHFDERIWVCVSNPFEEGRIAIEILESLLGQKPDLDGMDNILRRIRACVSGKKILLVLDDVWTEDSTNWEQLKGSLKTSSPGSRILVTTRNEMVGKAIGSRKIDMLFLGKLSEDKCWSLFRHLAFFERTREECQNLEEIGRKMVERCKGLPLAVKVVGGLLRFTETKEKWQNILDSNMWEIENVEKHVFPPLLLSYYDLPPVLRQCFSFCAIFPKDYCIRKDHLIRLWRAQGFLKETQRNDWEIIGEEYFNKLAMRSFFQEVTKVKFIGKITCKMHDMVHDFAQFLTKEECLLMEIDGVKEPWKDSSFKTIRHSMMIVEKGVTFPVAVNNNWGKLRSLLVKGSTGMENLLNSIDQVTCLRALDLTLSFSSLPINNISEMLTDKIEKLIHLRYLNLSGLIEMEKLPEAVCDLYNLQILEVTDCSKLAELPHGIGKLINLGCLENRQTRVRFMPKGFEGLTRLQTLSEFSVGSGDTKNKSCGLEGLGKLTHLRGTLALSGLGNVEEASEAREARLSAKTGLRDLILSFGWDGKRQITAEGEASVLEALQPPPTLETLEISQLKGPNLCPNWMTSLTMLKSVTLCGCHNWESLPPMGKLPSLEDLRIECMWKVKKVGVEFLGVKSEEGQTSSSSSAVAAAPFANPNVAFPKLERLKFLDLESWEEWELHGNLSTSRRGGQDSSSSSNTIMPRLRSLDIIECSKLKAVPDYFLQNTAIKVEIRKLWDEKVDIENSSDGSENFSDGSENFSDGSEEE